MATKAAGLVGEGVRDGAVARAVNDYLYAHRRAQVQASLTILSADLSERVLRVSRNTPCPAIFLSDDGAEVQTDEAQVIGVRRLVRPIIRQMPLEPGAAVVSFTDGVLPSGRVSAGALSIERVTALLAERRAGGAEVMARALLDAAIAADAGRPRDDMTVVVLAVTPAEEQLGVREMVVRSPVGPGWGGAG